MKVDKIEIQKNNKEKANIFIDGKYSFSITLNGLLDAGIHEGDELTEEAIETIRLKDAPGLAFLKAIDIASYSMKTEKELIKKLKEKKFPDEAINAAVIKMKEYGYIDDSSYASSYITSRAIPNGWGEQKIISMLLQKGIDMEVIKEKIDEAFTDDIKIQAALEVAKKYAARLDGVEPKKARQKLYQHLASKGYKYDIIKSVCNEIMSNNKNDFEDY